MMRRNYVSSDVSYHLCVIDVEETSRVTSYPYLVEIYPDAATFLKVYYLKMPL